MTNELIYVAFLGMLATIIALVVLLYKQRELLNEYERLVEELTNMKASDDR
jgi:cell division protein FtsL